MWRGEWTKAQTLKLIELWHSKPCLWNAKSPEYKNRNKKRAALAELSAEMGISEMYIEKRFISLKTQYSRAIQKTKGKSGAGAEDQDSGWYAFEYLHFLRNVNTSRPSLDTSTISTNEDNNSENDNASSAAESERQASPVQQPASNILVRDWRIKNKNPKTSHEERQIQRFMRKPNISEATNEFIALAIQCEHSDQPAFAGHAYVGAAKCEASAGNFLGEAEHYVAAARQFMKAEKKLWALKFYSPERENLEAAIGCFMQALGKYPEKSPIRVSILMELAGGLASLNQKMEAVSYYEQALEIIVESSMKMMCLRSLLNLQIDCGKFDTALETANSICDSKSSLPEDILSEVQVSRILLALLIKPPEETQPISMRQLFVDLMNDNESDATPFNTDLRLKLQSIIISHATGDAHSLVIVAADSKQFLITQQIELLQKIITDQRLEQLSLI